MRRVLRLSLFSALVLGCRSHGPIHDPFEHAIHSPRIGHEIPPDVEGGSAALLGQKDVTASRTPGRYGSDVDDLQRIVETNWAARELHEQLDRVNVPIAFAELRAKLKRSARKTDVAHAVRETLCRLGDGHLRLVETPKHHRLFDSGIRVDVVGGSYVVTDVDGRYASSSVRPRKGDMIVEADGKPIGELYWRQCLRPGSTPAHREHLAAALLGRQHRANDESPHPAVIRLRRARGRAVNLPLRWSTPSSDSRTPCVTARKIHDRAGRIDLDSFACEDMAVFEAELELALDTIAGVRDVIIDLRRNGGGDDAMAKAAARRFVGEPTTWMRFRHHDPEGAPASTGFSDEPFVPEPASRFGASRIWVLTGPGCFSTCEIFASVLATQSNVTLIGSPTAGGVGNPEPWKMPRSQITVSVPRTVYALPGTDMPIEGHGVPVDVEVRRTVEDVVAGRDAVLEAALSRIDSAR